MRIKRSFKVVMGPRTRYGEIWNKWLNPKGIEEQWLNPQESIIHLHDCNKAQRIWNLLQLDINQQAFNQDNTSWICHYAKVLLGSYLWWISGFFGRTKTHSSSKIQGGKIGWCNPSPQGHWIEDSK